MAEKTSSAGDGEVVTTSADERPTRHRRVRRRTFYSIGEVCSMIGVKPHVLRYWESQFPELSPAKNRAGNRVYQSPDIELIALIHRLVHGERYTVEGARKRIMEMKADGLTSEHSASALERAYLRTLESELIEIHDLLDPNAVAPRVEGAPR